MDAAEPKTEAEPDGKRLIARDAHATPLFSAFDWTEDAIARVQRVPAGFMRDRTQARIEELAQQQGSQQIDLERVEAGIELGLNMMAEIVSQHSANSDPKREDQAAAAAQCPAGRRRDADPQNSSREEPLNEVRPITELGAVRMLLTEEDKSGDR